MKKLLLSVFVLLVIFAFKDISIAQPKDVTGWRGTKWGMTESEIIANFKGEAVKLKAKKTFMSKFATIGINEFLIDSNKYEAYFLFDTSNTLQQVNIYLVSSVSKKSLEDVFNSLKENYTKVYGKPVGVKDRTKETFRNLGAAWSFPSTVILMDAIIGNSDQVFVLFQKNVGRNLEKMGYIKPVK